MFIDKFTNYITCSLEVKEQINTVVGGLSSLLKSNLLGMYLHGSMVLGAFDEGCSDIDMLGIIENGLSVTDKIEIGSFLLSLNHKPCPVEVALVIKGNIIPWQYPTICHFYFSDYWTLQYQQFSIGENLTHNLLSGHLTDYEKDIATDIRLIKQTGICLYGLSINGLLPEIPEEHFWDSISSDAASFYVESDIDSQSSYLVLSLCRILAYKKTGKILSKQKAANWALDILHTSYHPIILSALHNHYGLGAKISYTKNDALLFKTYMVEQINT